LQQSCLPPNIRRIPNLADLSRQSTDNHKTDVSNPPASSTGGEGDNEETYRRRIGINCQSRSRKLFSNISQ
jgi:hypothetical protein